jgi:putative ABC transport system permease protein
VIVMGRIVLIGRLVVRDLRHRPVEAALVLLAIGAATAVLTLGLILHGVTSNPYAATKAATKGPDVVAQLNWAGQAKTLVDVPGVSGHSGPYPVVGAVLRVHDATVVAMAEGRDQAPATVDQPDVTQGGWIRPGEVVLERTFAGALGVVAGDRISVNGQLFTVAGVGVTAASPPYPNLCYTGCGFSSGGHPGLIWLTKPDLGRLSNPDQLSYYLLNLMLNDPAKAQALAGAYNSNPSSTAPYLISWPDIASADGLLVADEQTVLQVGSWLAALLALASVAVLSGGRMAEQTRRVGLLKAVGGTPGTVAAVLLAEHLTLALTAAGAGLAIGWLTAPLLSSPGAGLIGTPDAPSLTLSAAGLVLAVAVAVALAATLVPAIRTSRTSTVRALAEVPRRPRRRRLLIAISTRLPVPLLIGLRLAARRLRRTILSAASTAITVTGVVAVLAFQATAEGKRFATPGESNPVIDRDMHALMLLTVVLLTLAVVNAIFTAWVTALDAQHSSAMARAFGATPGQLTVGLAAAQVLPAMLGTLVGVPLGIEFFAAANHAGILTIPPASWLVAVVLGTPLVVGLLTAVPARLGARRPVAEVLQAELA